MLISRKEVEYIANLARLELSDAEIAHFQEQLESILGYIDKLKNVDISRMSAMAHVLDIKNVFRSDNIKASIDTEEVLKYSPKREGSFFVVPKVIE